MQMHMQIKNFTKQQWQWWNYSMWSCFGYLSAHKLPDIKYKYKYKYRCKYKYK